MGKLIFVMVFTPVVMNLLQFWLQDNIFVSAARSAQEASEFEKLKKNAQDMEAHDREHAKENEEHAKKMEDMALEAQKHQSAAQQAQQEIQDLQKKLQLSEDTVHFAEQARAGTVHKNSAEMSSVREMLDKLQKANASLVRTVASRDVMIKERDQKIAELRGRVARRDNEIRQFSENLPQPGQTFIYSVV